MRRISLSSSSQVLLLTLFAAIERHAIDVLVEAYEREAQFGLLSVAVSIELDQRVADEPAKPRGGARVCQGAPDHVTGNRKTAPAHVKDHVSREHPQNPDETAKEKRRLQEADAEIGREFGQMTGILMDTLVRVSADLSGIGEAKCAPRL